MNEYAAYLYIFMNESIGVSHTFMTQHIGNHYIMYSANTHNNARLGIVT